MAFRLRRGTNAERLAITPVDGELIWATDTKKLWAGDGVTAGGVAVGGDAIVPRYEAALGNATNFLIIAATHGVPTPSMVTVLTPTSRSREDVYYEIRANGDVFIDSNINLLNHILIIF